MRSLYPIVHFGNHSLLDGPRGPVDTVAHVLAHFPEDWANFRAALTGHGHTVEAGMELIVEMFNSWENRPSPVVTTPGPDLDTVHRLFDEIHPMIRRGFRVFDSYLLDHLVWGGQDLILHALRDATRYAKHTGRTQLLS